MNLPTRGIKKAYHGLCMQWLPSAHCLHSMLANEITETPGDRCEPVSGHTWEECEYVAVHCVCDLVLYMQCVSTITKALQDHL